MSDPYEAAPRVLLIEDFGADGSPCAQAVNHVGGVFQHCDSPAEALALVRSVRPAVVLLSLDLRGISGLEVLKLLRDPRDEELLVVAIADRDDDVGAAEALRQGANDFVVRPVDPRSLATRLRVLFATRADARRLTPPSLRAVGTEPIVELPEPQHFCPSCATVAEGRRRCAHCGADAPRSGWPALADSPFPLLGRTLLGRYYLDRHVDAGAASDVYRARDLYVGRWFAVKVARTADHAASVHTFETEARALGQVHSPHVVHVYELHTLPDGRPFVVMDFVDGCNLRTWVDRMGPPRIDAAVGIAAQLARGLHAAHSHGVVHRDVKPANVMIEELPAGGHFVRLLDFGLAGSGASARQTFTGSAAWAAPEQFVPGEAIGAGADAFALGAVLYYLLTGEPPYEGESIEAQAQARMNGAPKHLDAIANRGAGEAVLAELVRDLLAPSPAARLIDMEIVLRRLETLP